MTLAVPGLLETLIASGRWPRNGQEANAQNLKSLVSPQRVRSLAAEESTIYLLPPPFRTVREASIQNNFWNWPTSDPGGIDFDLAIDIGDFGPGSDAPILLDYRVDLANPRVIRLRWSDHGDSNRWVVMAPDLTSFVGALGL